MVLFVASGVVAALAGLLYAARLGSVRGDMAQGFELDIITIVLLGGVSIFGGSGNLVGVGLSILRHPQPPQRHGSCQHHRQHPDQRHRGPADPVGAGPEHGADRSTRDGEGERHEEDADWRARGAGAAGAAARTGALGRRRTGDAGQGGQHGAAAEIPRHRCRSTRRTRAPRRRRRSCRTRRSCSSSGRRRRTASPGRSRSSPTPPRRASSAIMISNNSGDQIVPAAKAAQAKGIKVVTWDSPIPSAEGEDVFVAQVDFTETGKVMADMALDILGPDGGKFAILSASPDAANQNAWIAAMKRGAQGPEVRQAQAGRHRLRQRPVGEELQPGAGAGRQVPGHEADHGADLGRHRRRRQGDAGREAVRQGQGQRPRPAERDAGLHQERLRARVRAVELRRPRLPDLLHRLRARDRRDQGRGRRRVHGRPAWATTRSPRTRPAPRACAC